MSNIDTINHYGYIFDTEVIVEMNMTVWIDVRYQGWADRWRLRRDAMSLPRVTRPERQAAE